MDTTKHISCFTVDKQIHGQTELENILLVQQKGQTNYTTGLEITYKIWVSVRKTCLRNWVSVRFLGFPFRKSKSEVGFPKMLSQSLLAVHYDFCYLDTFMQLAGMNSDHPRLGQNKSFPMVYNMPMFMSFSWGFQSENLVQILDFLHHFWVSRKSGNPVISSPVPK